jgi:hypothetical protein
VTNTPSPAQIADLLAWARRLSEAGHRRDPADRAAFQTAKADLLARIAAGQLHHHTTED